MNADRFISFALTQSVQVVVVIALVAIATLTLCRRRPHLAYALWLLALVKCVTPPLWSSPTSVFSWAGAQVRSSTSMPLVSETKARPELDPLVPAKPSHQAASVSSSPLAPPNVAWPSLVTVAWLLGTISYLAWAIARLRMFRRHVRKESLAPPNDVSNLLSDLRRSLRVRGRVDLRVTRSNIGPAVVGVWWPMIVIPQALLSSDREDLRRIIAHELIHLRRRDHWIAAVQTLVQAIWWPNPLVWWMNRRIDQTRELSCDEEVIASLHCDAPSYVQMLLNVLHFQRKLAVPAIGVGMQSFDVTTRRMDHLLSARRFTSRAPWKSWLAFLIGALVLLPGAGLAISQTERASTSQTGGAADTVRFDGVVTDFVTKQPIEGARVILVRGEYDAEASINGPADGARYEVKSDAEGKVAIDIPLNGVVKGSCVEVRVYHPKYAPRTAQFVGLWKSGAPRREPIVKNNLLVLIAGEEITGVVEDPEGRPLPDTKVSIRSVGGDEQTRFLKELPELSLDSSVTDEQGRFRFNAVKDANFVTIRAEPTRFAMQAVEYGNRRADIGAIRVTRGAKIAGLLLDHGDKPVSGVLVRASSPQSTRTWLGAYERYATTNAQGQFTMNPLRAGEYRIAPADNRFMAQSVTIPENWTAHAMTFHAVEEVTVRGKVIHAKDAPRSRQPFEIFGGEGVNRFTGRATTDADGNFEFRVPAGLTNVQFNPSSGNDGYVYQWKRGEDGKLRGGEITLANLDAEVTDLIMIEQRAATLTIKATTPGGAAPKNGIGAEIRYAEPDLWREWGTNWRDNMQRGDVAIEYADQRQRAVIKQLVPDRKFTATVWVKGFEPASQTLSLGEGESREIEIKLTPQGTR